MELTPETLLAGPRGRGLCLELVDEPDARAAIWEARTSGTRLSRGWSFGFFSSQFAPRGLPGLIDRARMKRRALAEARRRRTPMAPEALATALRAGISRGGIPTPDRSQLIDALRVTVGEARAFQPPDAIEATVAHPAVVHSLVPIAQSVADAPFASAWSGGLDTSQWFVHLDRGDAREGVVERSADTAALLASWAAKERATEARSAREKHPPGWWWSVPPREIMSTTGTWSDLGPVGLYLVEDEWGSTAGDVTPVVVPDDARVFEIDSPSAWAALCRDYPLDVTSTRRGWAGATGRDGGWVIPDWEAMAQDWDGVHLTIAAYLACATTAIEVSDGTASVIAGWNPDETFWLRERPAPVGPPRRWRRTDATGWREIGPGDGA